MREPAAPRLDEPAELTALEAGVENARLVDADASGARLRGLRLRDVVVERGNLANLDAGEAAFNRVAIAGARLTGAQLARGKLVDVVFRDCLLNLATFAGTTLQPGQTVNRLTYKPGSEFVVKFANQGDNDEFQIKVTVRIKAGTQTTTLNTTVPKVVKGATADAHIPLDKTPPLDSAATITVTVAPVPGEKKTDNNTSDYSALFTRG